MKFYNSVIILCTDLISTSSVCSFSPRAQISQPIPSSRRTAGTHAFIHQYMYIC